MHSLQEKDRIIIILLIFCIVLFVLSNSLSQNQVENELVNTVTDTKTQFPIESKNNKTTNSNKDFGTKEDKSSILKSLNDYNLKIYSQDFQNIMSIYDSSFNSRIKQLHKIFISNDSLTSDKLHLEDCQCIAKGYNQTSPEKRRKMNLNDFVGLYFTNFSHILSWNQPLTPKSITFTSADTAKVSMTSGIYDSHNIRYVKENNEWKKSTHMPGISNYPCSYIYKDIIKHSLSFQSQLSQFKYYTKDIKRYVNHDHWTELAIMNSVYKFDRLENLESIENIIKPSQIKGLHLELEESDFRKLSQESSLIRYNNLAHLIIKSKTSSNKSTGLPSNFINNIIKSNPNLETLEMINIKESDFPKDIVQLKNLRNISLFYYNNSPSEYEIPSNIWEIKNLESLKIEGSNLGEIPSKIKQLTNLKYLKLRGFRSTDNLFKSQATYSKLKYFSTNLELDLDKNIPYKFPNLEFLTTKSIDLELLKIYSFKNLKALITGTIKNPKYFNTIDNLIYLKVLSEVGMNKTTYLPKNLRGLDLNINSSSSIPNSVLNSLSLEYLNLYAEKLYQIPNELKRLKKLTHIKINTNNYLGFPNKVNSTPILVYEPFLAQESYVSNRTKYSFKIRQVRKKYENELNDHISQMDFLKESKDYYFNKSRSSWVEYLHLHSFEDFRRSLFESYSLPLDKNESVSEIKEAFEFALLKDKELEKSYNNTAKKYNVKGLF